MNFLVGTIVIKINFSLSRLLKEALIKASASRLLNNIDRNKQFLFIRKNE